MDSKNSSIYNEGPECTCLEASPKPSPAQSVINVLCTLPTTLELLPAKICLNLTLDYIQRYDDSPGNNSSQTPRDQTCCNAFAVTQPQPHQLIVRPFINKKVGGGGWNVPGHLNAKAMETAGESPYLVDLSHTLDRALEVSSGHNLTWEQTKGQDELDNNTTLGLAIKEC